MVKCICLDKSRNINPPTLFASRNSKRPGYGVPRPIYISWYILALRIPNAARTKFQQNWKSVTVVPKLRTSKHMGWGENQCNRRFVSLLISGKTAEKQIKNAMEALVYVQCPPVWFMGKTNTKPQKMVVFSKPDFSLKCLVDESNWYIKHKISWDGWISTPWHHDTKVAL